MSDDIDDMTEKQINEEMERLRGIQRDGNMTPRQAARLERLRIASRTIYRSRYSVYR